MPDVKSFLRFNNSDVKTQIPTDFIWYVLSEDEEIHNHYDILQTRELLNFFYPGICIARRHFNQVLFCLLKTDLKAQLGDHFDDFVSHKMAERFYGKETLVHSIRNCKMTRGWEWKAWMDYYPAEKTKIHTDIAWDFANCINLQKAGYSAWVVKGNVSKVIPGIEINTKDVFSDSFNRMIVFIGNYFNDCVGKILTIYTRPSAIDMTNGRINVPVRNYGGGDWIDLLKTL